MGWLSRSAVQRALWFIDEVDARWERNKESSLEKAIEQLQNLILGSCEKPPIPKDLKKHVKPVEDHGEFLRISKLLDLKYQQVMNYSMIERKLIMYAGRT